MNYWMHNNFLSDKTGKMSKSNEEFLTLNTIIEKGYNPSAFRYLLMTSSYRTELAFSYESLDAAKNAFNKLCKYMHMAAKEKDNIVDATKYRINTVMFDEFMSHIYNDLNTPSAVAVMWNMINEKRDHAYSTVLAMNKILGLDITYTEKQLELSDEDEDKINELFEQRKIARSNKDWATSDDLRSQIQAFGVEVVD